MITQDELQDMCQQLKPKQVRFTGWESDFIESVETRINAGIQLTAKQEEWLVIIWDKYCVGQG